MRNYTGYGWEGENYSENLSTKDIAKIIRQRLKKEFPEAQKLAQLLRAKLEKRAR